MRRVSSETAATVALVVLLLGVIGVVLAVNRSAPADPPPAGDVRAQPTAAPRATESQAPVEPAPQDPSPPPVLPSVTASACPSLSTDVPLTVITLNTHGARGPAGFSVDRVARLILAADADVALLQEVDSGRPRSRFVDMPDALARATGMEVAYGLNVNLGPRRGVSGVATLSRFPILGQVNTRLPHQPGLKPRGVLRTDLDVRGVTVSVFNTHLEPGGNPIRLRQMSAAMAELATTEHPAILGGDLNAVPGSPTLRIATGLLRDAWSDAGLGPAATAPASNPRIRIDYLLYGPPLRPTRSDVLSVLVSDHRGVRTRFVLSIAGDKVCVPVLDGALGSGDG